MIRAMIVDDEEKSRYGLSEFFDFARHGVAIVGYAANGQEALDMAERLAPELILTDVKMPVMDGIALARALSERFPQTCVIFISGYDDLTYIKAALRLAAFDYLIKPVDAEEFNDVMARVARRIATARKQSQWIEQARRQIDDTLPFLTEKHHRDLLLSGGAPVERPALLPTPVRQEALVLLLRPVARPGRQNASMAAMLDLCKRQASSAVVVQTAPDELAVVLSQPNPREAGFACAARLQHVLRDVLAQEVTVALGAVSPDAADLYRSYETARRLLDDRALSGAGQILLHEAAASARETPPAPDDAATEALAEAFREGDGALLRKRVDQLLRRALDTPGITLAQFRLAALQLIYAGRSLLRSQGVSPESALTEPERLQYGLSRLETQEAVLALVQDAFESLLADYGAAKEEQTNLSVRRMKKYIQAHYARAVTVQEVAGHAYLATPYACTLFKQETGVTINDYLTQQRMRAARELLETTQQKLYQISQAVGYTDQAYFTKQFRKHCGMSPAEYRRRKG